MIYSFSNTIFENLDDESLDLLDKIWTNSKDRHLLFIANNQNFDSIKSSEWYKNLRTSNQNQIDNQFVASAQLGKKRAALMIAHNVENTFSLKEASEMLCKPFTIILENMEYDAHFIQAIIENYKKEGREIKKHYNNGWLIYTNGGGNNIPNVINGMKNRFEKNKIQYPKNSIIYLRAFVIMDSDKKYPSEAEVAEDKIALLNFIKNNVPYHIMLKREMENYLPDAIYAEIRDNEIYKKAYLALTPIQKDFFDIEKGFPDKNFNQLETNVQRLYENVNDTAKNIFRKGGIVFYKEDGKKDSFKAKFSALFRSNNITRENLEQRTQSTNLEELSQILQKINELL